MEARFTAALVEVARRLRGLPEGWMLIGSTSIALQGMAVEPADIDIASSAAGAREIGRRLADHVVEPVHWRDSGRVASWFGEFEVEGTRVEVMGDLAVGERENRELLRPRWPVPVTLIDIEGHRIPCLPLAAEARGYEKFGRPETAAAIRRFLQGAVA